MPGNKQNSGLSDSWKFWRARESGDVSATSPFLKVALESSHIDQATKTLMKTTFSDLKSAEQTKPVKTGVNSSPLTKVRLFPKNLNRASVSDREVLEKAIKDILRECRARDIERALQMFTDLPFEQDRARILLSLVSKKSGRESSNNRRAVDEMTAQRESFSNLDISPGEKIELMRRFFKAYYDSALTSE